MSKLKPLTTNISIPNYDKMQWFLQEYNKKTGQDLSMSGLVWKAVKLFVEHTIKSWKP